jgi:uncharacterized protein YjeT (DUF2065 family)
VDALSVLCILLGVLIIVTRGPMIVAPRATLRFYERLLSTDARVRGIGLVIGPLAVALVAFTSGEEGAAGILRALGWLSAAATLWLLAVPSSYRRLAQGVLDFFESSVDPAIVRIIGLLAVAIGVALIYVGIYVV